MKRVVLVLAILVCAVSANSQTAGRKATARPVDLAPVAAAAVSSLPIRRVILYSNGVAYIERRGVVTGKVEINLSFKQSQVDDVLKSMVVLDLGQGKIGAVRYNSSAPASARTAEIPFSIDAESEQDETSSGGLAAVLSQLQGAKVVVTAQQGTATGSILTVEKRKSEIKPRNGGEATTLETGYSLVLASDGGDIVAFDLTAIRGVKLLEDATRRDISEFANATASTRRRDAKTITVTSNGTGQREMVVSYTVAAPIWKTTYRVVLGDDGKPFFQGWAIIDNVSEEDWRDVQMSLVSGSPVSFIQNLQKPLYRYRPIIPIPEDLNLRPQIYDPEAGSGVGSGAGSGYGDGYGDGSGGGSGGVPPPPAPKPFVDANNNFIISSGYAGTGVSDALINKDGGVETAAKGVEIGDLFEYRIEQPVSVDRNQSALIPIVQTKMDGERVSIFRYVDPDAEPPNEDEDAETAEVRKANPRPMSGLLLKNTTPMTFEGGSMTILDRDAYAGEALMERLKANEQRLISFALDLGTLMRVEQKEEREPARMLKVVNGVFQVHYFKSDKRTYRLTNQTERVKTVYIEHPVRKGWSLSDKFAKPDYTTTRFYRFRVELKPFANTEITVAENLGMMDKYELTSLSPKDLEIFVASRTIDEPTRARLAKLIDLRMQINQINARLSAAAKEIEAISADQQRFRENIEALAKTAEAKQLIARYIAKANEQETQLEQMNGERKAMVAEKERLERELAIEIKNFEVS